MPKVSTCRWRINEVLYVAPLKFNCAKMFMVDLTSYDT